MKLPRAKLKDPKNSKHDVSVQFNPETLKLSYANQVSEAGKASVGGEQHIGGGSTKLAVQLWFDVTAPVDGGASDVRELTEKILYFITPDPGTNTPPVLRFEWGTFNFEGVVESIEESLEFFSPEGVPLRASVSIGMTQPRIKDAVKRGSAPPGAGRGGPTDGAPAGTVALTPAPAGASIQRLAAQQGGDASNWRDLAEANNIENPRMIPTGTLLDLGRRGRGGR